MPQTQELPVEVIAFIEELMAEGFSPETIEEVLTDEEFLDLLNERLQMKPGIKATSMHVLAARGLKDKDLKPFNHKRDLAKSPMHLLAGKKSLGQHTAKLDSNIAKHKAAVAAAPKSPGLFARAHRALSAGRDAFRNKTPASSSGGGGNWADKMRGEKKGGGAYTGHLQKESTLEEGGPTKKHFIETAKIIAALPAHKKQEFANHHASIYAHQNPRFDHARWHKACGTKHGMNEDFRAKAGKNTKEKNEAMKEIHKKSMMKSGKMCKEDMYHAFKQGKLAWGGVSDILAESAVKALAMLPGKDRQEVMEAAYLDRDVYNKLLKGELLTEAGKEKLTKYIAKVETDLVPAKKFNKRAQSWNLANKKLGRGMMGPKPKVMADGTKK